MAKEMLINVSEGEECRIALLEDGKLEELYMERTSSTSHVGNIYKGKVTNVEPSIQAAFVDFGLGRNGFLHISDLLPQYFGRRGEDVQESVGRKMARRDRPPIQRCLRRGDEIIVQIIKEGIGTKGPTLSTYLSIPGRILVMMPGMSSKGVSRKIEDEEERRRLRKILDELKPPKDCGFIIRTAGIGKTKAEIERDLKYLTRLWETIAKSRDEDPAPVELYTEGDLVTRSVRDVFTNDVERIIVDNKDVSKKIKDFMKLSAPRTKNKVELYEDPVPLFHKYGIEREIEQMYSRHVPLPSGGSLVIDSTEAIVAIDVNSGKFRDHSDAETTAFKTDMEAADEIARQLKLRDLGGVIICDFIDLRFERHRRTLEERLHNNLKNDRAKTKVLRMSQFGIIEMTRQRMRPSLKRSVYFDCPHCKGSGLVKTPESMSLDVMRRLAIALHDQRVARVDLAVSNDVAFYMLNRNRAQLADLETETGKHVNITANPTLALDEHKMVLLDARDGLVYMPDLGIVPEIPGGGGRPQHGGARHPNGHQPPRRDDRNRRHQQPTRGGPVPTRRGEEHEEDEMEMVESVEDAVDRREEEQEDALPAVVAAPSRTPESRDRGRGERRDDRGGNPPRRDGRGGGQPQQQQQRRDDRGGRDNRDQGRGDNRGGGRERDRNRQPDRAPQQQQPQRQQQDRRDRQPAPANGSSAPAASDVIELDAEGHPSGGADVAHSGDQHHDQQQPQEGGGRRRRRRRRGGRGRGGRGNGGGGQPQQPFGAEADAADHDEPQHADDDRHDHEEAAHESLFPDDRFHDVEPESAEDRHRERDLDRVLADEEPVVSRGRGRAAADDDEGIAPAPEPIEDTPAPAAEEVATEEEPPSAPPPAEEKPKRRRGGATGARARGGTRKPRASKATAAAAEAKAESPVRIPPPPVAEEPAPVVRTGSTDRHQLRDDEDDDVAAPVITPEPAARRPRSYRDLDEIPDDFD